MPPKVFIVMALVMFGLVFATGCGDEGGGDVKKVKKAKVVRYGPVGEEAYQPVVGRFGGQIVMASFGEGLKSFNPITAGETSTTDYTKRIFDGLLDFNIWTQEPKPGLAERWEHSDDFLEWTFYLRQDIKFNNGDPLTAADVVFTFDTIYREDITSSTRDMIMTDGKRWEVEALDAHTVKVRIPSVYAVFLELVGSIEILNKRVCEPAVLAGEFNSFMGAESTPQQVVGTGPFMLQSYEAGQKLILKRNPYYWKKDAEGNQLPYLDRMVFVWLQNIDAMMLKFKTGETDGFGLRGTDYPILKPMEAEGQFKIYELGPNMGSSYLIFNQNDQIMENTGKTPIAAYKLKWFKQTAFRQAISHAIDRAGLIATVYNGLGVEQYGPKNAGSGYFYNPHIKTYAYDLEKSKAMLAAIGLIDRDGDGVLEDEDGNLVEFTMLTNSGNNIREQTSEILRKDMAKLGIKVNLKYIEFNTLIRMIDETYDWEALVFGLTGGPEPHFGSNVWKSSGRLHMWQPKQKTAATEWEARIDAIFDQGIKEMDRAKRKVLYDEWQTIVNEQQPFIYTVSPMILYGFKDKFGNVYPTTLAAANRAATTWNIEEVYIKEGYPLE